MVNLISFIEEKYVVGTHWILLNEAIPMFTDNMSYLNKDFFKIYTCQVNPNCLGQFRGIPWNQTTDVHRGSTLITRVIT